MSNDVILFNDAAHLPAYVRDLAQLGDLFKDTEKDVSQFASYPSISIKGKTWTLVEGGERKVMMKPGGEEGEIAQFIDVAIIRANDSARTFYAKKFTEAGAADGEKPACHSMDGIAPSPRAVEPQSAKCATCKHAVWGSAIKEDGTAGKGTACGQNARLAIAAPDAMDKPFLLRVPPKSLKPMRDAIAVLRERKLPYPVAVFRLGFDPKEASPVITFRPVGLLSDVKAQQSVGMREAMIVKQIIGQDEQRTDPVEPPPLTQTHSELDAAIAAKAAADKAAATAPVPAPQPAPPPPPPPAPAPVQAAAPGPDPFQPSPSEQTVQVLPAGAGGGLLDELNSLLGNIDK